MAIRAIGLTRYGWKHLADGTSLCRQWFMVLYLPVVPLRRWRVVSHNERPRGFLSGISAGVGLGGIALYQEDLIDVQGPAEGAEDILPTYLRFWGAFAAIVGALVGFIPAKTWLTKAHLVSERVIMYTVFPLGIGLFLGLPIAFALVCHQASFGIRPARLIEPETER